MSICCQFPLYTITYFYTIYNFRHLIKDNQFESLWLYPSKRADYSDEWRSSICSHPLFGKRNHSTGSSTVRSSHLLYPVWPFHSGKARFHPHRGIHEQYIHSNGTFTVGKYGPQQTWLQGEGVVYRCQRYNRLFPPAAQGCFSYITYRTCWCLASLPSNPLISQAIAEQAVAGTYFDTITATITPL